MKTINFINAPSIKKQQAVRTWSIITALCFISCTSAGIYVYMIDYLKLTTIEAEIQKLQAKNKRSAPTSTDERKSEEKILSEKLTLLSNIKTHQQKLFQHFREVHSALKPATQLISLSMSNGTLEISLHCQTPSEAIATQDALKKTFPTLRLTSLTATTTPPTFRFTATLKTT